MGFGLVGALIIGLLVAYFGRRYYRSSWKADRLVDDLHSVVTLLSGPWQGARIKLSGTPALGAKLSTDTRGLVGSGIHDGCYVVVESNPVAATATASWTLWSEQ